MVVGMPDFKKGQVENRAKTEKCSFAQGFEGGFLPFVPYFTILTQSILSDLKIEPNSKTLCF